MTQKKFASKIGVHVYTVQQYEAGNIPKGDVLQRIHEAFGVNINWLLTGEGEPFPKDEPKESPLNKEGIPHDYDRSQLAISGSATAEADHLPDPFGKAASQLREIYDYGDPGIISAIQANLATFLRTVRREKEVIELKNRLASMEKRIAALEDRLKAPPPVEPDELKRSTAT
ncbi:MAG: helix-turn-helix domain-containing protein [Deltaproteobacteria bacterium]|nr:helix-turn-helix domain-containing protein [Deltaproteobacteria bacterium]MBW2081655.1 helix-turn-helix domain-containing protein [Deltaproteobacteria bacterium]MBW2298850.1 helix-turn-helix domain-containing protein [Deltaproteobacteria bacterium]